MIHNKRFLVSGLIAIGIIIVAGGFYFGSKPKPTIVIEVPEKLTLFSTKPDEVPASSSDQTFHGYPILGQLDINDVKQRETIIKALNRGIQRGDRGGGEPKCFWPRHGVRAVRQGQTTDYLICFQCEQIVAYARDKTLFDRTDRSPQQMLNKILTDAGLELPVQPKSSD